MKYYANLRGCTGYTTGEHIFLPREIHRTVRVELGMHGFNRENARASAFIYAR